MQSVGNVAPCMEHDLGRAEYVQTAVGVDGAVSAESLHHGLLAGFGVIHMVDDYIAPGQNGIDIAGTAFVVSAQVPFVIGSHRAQTFPVILRMDEDRVVLGRVVIQHSFQHVILDLDELQRFVYAFFILTGHNGNHIAHKAHMAVNDQPVTGACLREGLACLGVAGRILRHILPGEDGFNAGHLLGHGRVDRPDHGVCMRRAQQLDDQAVLRDHIIHIDRLAGDQLHGVLFAERFVDRVHLAAASFCFFQSRKFRMPRSWPS